LSAKLVGAVLVPECVPFRPNSTVPPAGIEPFHAAFFAVTTDPLWVVTELHDCATV
jgi:hypothetical protein